MSIDNPRHGNYLGYLTDKCRDECCRTAWAAHKKNTRKMQAYGKAMPKLYANPETARAHVNNLRAFGMSLACIATLAGENTSRMSELMYERHHSTPRRITVEREQRILNVRFDLDAIPARRTINAAGTRRRIEALMVAGWSQRMIGDKLGVTAQMVSLHRHRGAVTSDTARAIRDIYDELWDKPGSPRWARIARARGFAPAAAWDDDTIDNPAAVPDLGEKTVRPNGGAGRPTAELVEDVEWLLEQHPYATAAEIAARLGYADASGVQNGLKHDRGNRPDLLTQLARNAEVAA